MKKELTYKELKDLALKHYASGGDGVYECWDQQVFDEHVAEFGPITYEDAMRMFGIWDSICRDRMGS